MIRKKNPTIRANRYRLFFSNSRCPRLAFRNNNVIDIYVSHHRQPNITITWCRQERVRIWEQIGLTSRESAQVTRNQANISAMIYRKERKYGWKHSIPLLIEFRGRKEGPIVGSKIMFSNKFAHMSVATYTHAHTDKMVLLNHCVSECWIFDFFWEGGFYILLFGFQHLNQNERSFNFSVRSQFSPGPGSRATAKCYSPWGSVQPVVWIQNSHKCLVRDLQ